MYIIYTYDIINVYVYVNVHVTVDVYMCVCARKKTQFIMHLVRKSSRYSKTFSWRLSLVSLMTRVPTSWVFLSISLPKPSWGPILSMLDKKPRLSEWQDQQLRDSLAAQSGQGSCCGRCMVLLDNQHCLGVLEASSTWEENFGSLSNYDCRYDQTSKSKYDMSF